MSRKPAEPGALSMNDVALARYGADASRKMFSAASFFDVIDARPSVAGAELGEPDEVPGRPAVVAFYGFKGGAGRTMALAHVAIMLARRGLRVAAIDFDLEAPGLHVALGQPEPDDDDVGLVPLLHEILASRPDRPATVMDHVQVLSPSEGIGKIFLLPAGKISRRYLAQIEELSLSLWHAASRSPLERLFDGFEGQGLDVCLLDCRTGFSPMSASVLFHHADLAVVFLPLSEQVWSGVEMLLEATASARAQRARKPGLLFVPSLVPEGKAGQDKTRAYLDRLRETYGRLLGGSRSKDGGDDDESDITAEPWLDSGIGWDPRLSVEGAVREPFLPGGAWGVFQPLLERIVGALDLSGMERGEVMPPTPKILEELDHESLKAFAEDQSRDQMQQFLIPSQSVKAAMERNAVLIVGAKGAGKTLIWQYLAANPKDPLVPIPENTVYLVGHAPRPDLDPGGLGLSADAFKELEKAARMVQRGTHKAFWLLYALERLGRHDPSIGDWVIQNLPGSLRATWRSDRPIHERMSRLLASAGIATTLESLFAEMDKWMAKDSRHLVLLYDGLDTGFQTGPTATWSARRDRFVTGLLQVVAEWRTRLGRISFKVFLREDIFLSISLQNRSHLESARLDLRFGSSDLWQLALKIARTSRTFQQWQTTLRQQKDGLFAADDEELKRLLVPFWGRTVEKGKQAYTTNYIHKRTSDAQGRLFPRTFIQMISEAIRVEREMAPRVDSDRVLGFRSLQAGVRSASEKRTGDLLTEYIELKPYLEALKGGLAVATAKQLKDAMSVKVRRSGASLHKWPGSWNKVLDRLVMIGVFGKSADVGDDRDRYTAAQIYRRGLDLKAPGLH